MYRHQRHIYDATRKFYLLGRDRLIAELRPAPGDAVIEIGCGTGRNLILAARAYPQARFFGVDVSTEMLTSALEAIEQDGLSSRVRVAHADARDFDPAALFGEKRFARVMISYSLSMIPDWRAVLALALSLTAPGGTLHVVDFGGQERLPAWFRAALRAWLARFHVTPRDDLEATLTALCTREGATLTFERPFRGYAQAATVAQAATMAPAHRSA
jgi:S-adenosylmethionine-diacylgycerolhomoserine-N-methlytransferase